MLLMGKFTVSIVIFHSYVKLPVSKKKQDGACSGPFFGSWLYDSRTIFTVLFVGCPPFGAFLERQMPNMAGPTWGIITGTLW